MNGGYNAASSERDPNARPQATYPQFEIAIPIAPTASTLQHPQHPQHPQNPQLSYYQQPPNVQYHHQHHQQHHPYHYHHYHHSQAVRSPHPTPHSSVPPNPLHTTEYYLLLISLAESYFEAAHKLGAKTANIGGAEAKAYYKLIATGLACLESILLPQKGKTIPARLEALVRLRYACLLHEETDNTKEAESVLTKGIIVASRNNSLLDLSYSMQHLLVRVIFKMNPKAALIQLNGFIKDSHERENPLWNYAFRFLRCSLLLEQSQIRDEAAAEKSLRKIRSIAHHRGDIVIFIVSSLIGAVISLQRGPDGAEEAERCLAAANSFQLSEDQFIPQIEGLRLLVDLIHGLILGKPITEVETRLKNLQTMLGDKQKWNGWALNGEFCIPVNPLKLGKPAEKLRFRWLAREDLFVLGYFLSGLARFQSNTQEYGKAERYLKEGLRRVELPLESSGSIPYCAPAAQSRIIFRNTLRCYMVLYLGFLLAVRTEWDEAWKSLEVFEECLSRVPVEHIPGNLKSLYTYFAGTIHHGRGDLLTALRNYSQLMHNTSSEIGIMSTLNTVLILRGNENRDLRKADSLLSHIEKTCMESNNNLLKSAYHCVKGTDTSSELTKTKKHLATALRLAQDLCNQQVTYIGLSSMYHRFFNGVVSEQAEKSARAAWLNAKKGRDNLWMLISGRMFGECLSRQGEELQPGDRSELQYSMEQVMLNLAREGDADQAVKMEEGEI